MQRRELSHEVARALVASRVAVQVLLVVLLGGPPLAGRGDLGDDAAMVPLVVGLPRDLLGPLLLVLVVVVDGGAILGTRVGALAVKGGGVMGAVEELQELAVGDLGRVVEDLYSLGVCSSMQVS